MSDTERSIVREPGHPSERRGRTPFPSLHSQRTMLFFRTIGALAIVVVACVSPEVGPNRFLLAGLVAFVAIPGAIWLELRYPFAENGWSQPLFDLTVTVLIVHAVPQMWVPALVVGLMIVQAPSISESRRSHLYYGLFASILVVGMTLAAIVHDVPDWEFPILAMTVLYPSVIYYSYRQSQRTNEIRERSKALEGLRLVAGGVAHDFNNLLTSVLGNAEIASLDLADDHPSKPPLSDLIEGARRASVLSSRLLSFSGGSRHTAELLDVEEEIRELVSLLARVVPEGISLEVESTLDGERAVADRTTLQQIVMNVVLVAIESSEASSDRIAIELRAVRGADRDWIETSIQHRDAGRAHQKRVFDRFTSSDERDEHLGLARAADAMAELGGRIDVESRAGRGTTVRLRLPSVSALLADRDLRAPRPADGGTALIVDDEPSVRAVAARMLARLGYASIEAGDGPTAIELLREHREKIDLVVLDLRMPGMDGWACLDSLRTIRDDLPVVICSGQDPREPKSPYALGEVAHAARVAKPFQLDELCAAAARATAEPR